MSAQRRVPWPPPPPGDAPDTPARAAARAALTDVLWTRTGVRRLPGPVALQRALAACTPDDAWWVCEAAPHGPVYLLPTTGFIRALGRLFDALGASEIMEVAAGDGFLSRCLRAAHPGLKVRATDDASWSKPGARLTRAERKSPAGKAIVGLVPPPDVEVIDAVAAVERDRPDLVLVSWPPPGPLVESLILAPARYVLELSVDGDVCGDTERTWRFNKDFVEDELPGAWCRLDGGPAAAPRTRATLYYAARHPRHGTDE